MLQNVVGDALGVDDDPATAHLVPDTHGGLAKELEQKLVTTQGGVFHAVVVKPICCNYVVLLKLHHRTLHRARSENPQHHCPCVPVMVGVARD